MLSTCITLKNLDVNAQIPHSPCYKMRVLASEIEDEYHTLKKQGLFLSVSVSAILITCWKSVLRFPVYSRHIKISTIHVRFICRNIFCSNNIVYYFQYYFFF